MAFYLVGFRRCTRRARLHKHLCKRAPITNFNNYGSPNGTPHSAPTLIKPSSVPFLTFSTLSENILSLLNVNFTCPKQHFIQHFRPVNFCFHEQRMALKAACGGAGITVSDSTTPWRGKFPKRINDRPPRRRRAKFSSKLNDSNLDTFEHQ